MFLTLCICSTESAYAGISVSMCLTLCISLQGAYAGMVVSMGLTLWLGLGAQVYKPAVWKAPVNISGCNWDDVSNISMVTMETSTFSAMETTALEMTPPLSGDGCVISPQICAFLNLDFICSLFYS